LYFPVLGYYKIALKKKNLILFKQQIQANRIIIKANLNNKFQKNRVIDVN